VWLWICLAVSIFFLISWFWIGPRLAGRNNLKKLFAKLILIVIMADCVLTLTGQSGYYWRTYSDCNEITLIGEWLLELHPLAFVSGIIIWITLITFVIKKVNLFFSSVLSFAVFIGHAPAAWSWIYLYSKDIIEDLTGGSMSCFQETICEEVFTYTLCILIGLVLACILNKIRKNKSI